MSFSTKQLDSQETLGERLAARREALGFSRETAARAAGLPVKYITALEEGRYKFIPGVLYVRQYVRLYNGVLGFDIQELLAAADEELALLGGDHETTRHTRRATPALVKRLPLMAAAKKFGWGAGAVVTIAIMSLSLTRFFDAPPVEIRNPGDGIVIAKGSIEVQGWTEPESQITINGQQVVKSADGSFTEMVELKNGMNTLRIVAQKKHSRSRVIERRVLVE